MIPLRDTQDLRGPIPVTLLLILANFVLAVAGEIPNLNFWQVLLALLGLWLFGSYPERRLGSIPFLLVYLVVAGGTGFLVAGVDDEVGRWTVSLFLPVLALGALHLALAPRSRILAMVPIPFAMTFFEIPVVAMLVGWVGLEVLLTAV